MKKNIVKMSLVATMLLATGAYSAQIVGADVTNPNVPVPAWEANTQFGFGGLNLDNVIVNISTANSTFDRDTGAYTQMALGDSYESNVFSRTDPATKLGYLIQKTWPISEPTGIKVINNDLDTSNGKPQNCIMGSSYLLDSNLDTGTPPTPVICSSDAGTSKRIQLVLNENMVDGTALGAYGQSIDLVFNIDPDTASGDHRYQVFQKVSNFTGKRLDGFTLEVLNSAGVPDANLTLSLGINEQTEPVDGNITGDLWPDYEIAFYPPGLWGDGEKKHLEKGWFDIDPSGYYVSLDENKSMMTSGDRIGGNYVELFGNWQPDKWVPWGMHEVISDLEEPVLLAYWGTTPTEGFNDAPAWHYGMDHNQSDGVDTNFTTPTQEEFDKWAANPEKYVIDDIEDVPNVSLNYIVNVGEGIDNNFTIRIKPRVSVDQTPPSYISKDDNVSYIVPPQLWVKPIADAGPDVTVQVNETVTIIGTGTDPDGEIVSYEWKYDTEVVATKASFDYTPDTVGNGILTLTVTDNNGLKDTDSMNLTVTEVPVDPVDPVDPTDPPAAELPPVYYPSGGGGGCTYNPNSNSFDMTFLMMMALGLLYPFRRRFLK